MSSDTASVYEKTKSLSQNRWHLFEIQPDLNVTLARHLGVSPWVAQVLLNRGIKSLREAQIFLGLAEVSDETQLDVQALEAACALIQRCIDEKKRILLWGDYDVDGMTSTSLMMTVLKHLGAQVDFHIPDRFKEGYGLHMGVVEKIQQTQTSLLITLDCGVTNVAEIEAVKTHTSAQVIVMDHHRLGDTLPSCEVMLNPKCLSDQHACYELCTVGITYLFWVFYATWKSVSVDLDALLDLVAIGSIADIVKIQGMNRVLIRKGLTVLQKRQRLGIRTLLEHVGFDRAGITEYDIGFVIGPRLNAAGRLAHAKHGVDLLTATTPEVALKESKRLETMNQDRRALDADVFQHAYQKVVRDPLSLASPLIVVVGERWHPGVIGIVASKLVAQFCKPVVVISHLGEVGKGSARTYGTVNIHAILAEFKDYFENFGGHKEAAGLTILASKLEAFKTAIQTRSQAIIAQDELSPILQGDAVLALKEVDVPFVEALDQLRPFGPGNPRPLFYSEPVRILEARQVGQNGAHLKVVLQSTETGHVLDGIGFNLGDRVASCYDQDMFRFAYHVSVNEWKGVAKPQLEIIDFK